MFALYGTCTFMLNLRYQLVLVLSDSSHTKLSFPSSLFGSFALCKHVCKGLMRHSWS